MSVNGSNYTCLGINGECDYQTSSSMPVVSSIAQQDAYTLVFTGVGFSFTGFPAQVRYINIKADSVTVDSDTQVTAVFTNGIPLSQSAKAPVLFFKDSASAASHWAASSAKYEIRHHSHQMRFTITNPVTASALNSQVQCSFAGGCLIQVNQPGLLTNIMNDPVNNYINVCSEVCTVSNNQSSATQTSCNLPTLATNYSITNFNVSSMSYLEGTPFSSNA